MLSPHIYPSCFWPPPLKDLISVSTSWFHLSTLGCFSLFCVLFSNQMSTYYIWHSLLIFYFCFSGVFVFLFCFCLFLLLLFLIPIHLCIKRQVLFIWEWLCVPFFISSNFGYSRYLSLLFFQFKVFHVFCFPFLYLSVTLFQFPFYLYPNVPLILTKALSNVQVSNPLSLSLRFSPSFLSSVYIRFLSGPSMWVCVCACVQYPPPICFVLVLLCLLACTPSVVAILFSLAHVCLPTYLLQVVGILALQRNDSEWACRVYVCDAWGIESQCLESGITPLRLWHGLIKMKYAERLLHTHFITHLFSFTSQYREGPSYGSRRYGSAFFRPNEISPFSLELSPSISGKIKERTRFVKSLRAKGTPISEPRSSTPCEMRFSPREKGKMASVEGFSLKRPFSLSRVGKIASRRG